MLYQTSCIWTDRKEKRQTEQYFGKKLLQYSLFSECGVMGEPILERGEHGKPYLKEYPQITYNLTHTDTEVYLYMEQNYGEEKTLVGVDAETIRKIPDSMPERTLSQEEKESFSKYSKKEQELLFFRLWTLKESFLKALGIGITVPLSSVSFQIEGDNICCKQAISESQWHFAQFQRNQTIVSVCSNQALPKISADSLVQCRFRPRPAGGWRE